MKLSSPTGALIEIVNEPSYVIGSMDNQRRYAAEFRLENVARPTSVHGVLLNGSPAAVLAAGGGCTSVHGHSALLRNGRLYLAVGRHLACLGMSPVELIWSKQVDAATCFGIYYEPLQDALISHGELDIARVSDDGELIWSQSGADIFTEGFYLRPECIEAIDFSGRRYCLSYGTGTEVKPPDEVSQVTA